MSCFTRLLVLFVLLLLLSGCAGLVQRLSQPAADTDTAPTVSKEKDLSREIDKLFEQPKIDPLTRYLEEHDGDPRREELLEQVRAERQQRCEAIAEIYAGRSSDQANLNRLRRAYSYSCPDLVRSFAKQVEEAERQAAVADPSSTPEAPEDPSPDDVQDDPEVAAAVEEVDKEQLENCLVLSRIRNYREAVQVCRKPAEKGEARAQYQLARALRGLQLYPEAVRWAKRAEQHQLPEAQHLLGLLYLEGQGVEHDAAKALGWFERAGDNGFLEAQYRAGSMLTWGEGVESDPEKGRQWLIQAAEQEHPLAQAELGRFYETGPGTTADPARAANWYDKAARQGVLEARSALAELYLHGRGVERDYSQAYIWASQAVIGGDERMVTTREIAASRLNQEQLVEAQQQTRSMLEQKR